MLPWRLFTIVRPDVYEFSNPKTGPLFIDIKAPVGRIWLLVYPILPLLIGVEFPFALPLELRAAPGAFVSGRMAPFEAAPECGETPFKSAPFTL